MNEDRTAPSSEQLAYARVLAVGMYAGLGLLLLTFLVYVSGLVDPAVPITELPDYWGLDVATYLETINESHVHREHGLTGWWWLGALAYSDYLNFVGIAVLSAVTIVCFVRIVPSLIAKGDFVYAVIATVEAVVLALAASGVFSVGH